MYCRFFRENIKTERFDAPKVIFFTKNSFIKKIIFIFAVRNNHIVVLSNSLLRISLIYVLLKILIIMIGFVPGTATVIAQSVSTSKSKKSVNSVDQVLSYARRKFDACPIKRSEIKAELLMAGLGKYGVPEEKFFAELDTNISMLLESTKFVKDCVDLELCPFIVAQHCVFAGMSYSMEILKKGLTNVFDNIYLKQMQEHIFPYCLLVEYDGNHRLRYAIEANQVKVLCDQGDYCPACKTCPVRKGNETSTK